MIVIFDGPQLAGKTTLIQELCKKKPGKVIKFPFAQVSKEFEIDDNAGLKGLQLGKDLGMLEILTKVGLKDKNIYIDRGFLSSAYYSLAKNRMDISGVDQFISRVGQLIVNSKNLIKVVWVSPVDPFPQTREKKDGFDGLDAGGPDTLSESYIYQAAEDQLGKENFIFFENNFLDPLKETVNSLIEKLNF